MAFKYDGSNPLIRQLVAHINESNSSGRVVPVLLEASGQNIRIFSEANQRLIMNSRGFSKGPEVVAEWVDASPPPPKPPKGKKGESFARRKARGEVVLTPYEKFRFSHTVVFIPKEVSSREVTETVDNETTASVTYDGYGGGPLGMYYRRWGWEAHENVQSTWISRGVYSGVRLAWLNRFQPGIDIALSGSNRHASWQYLIKSANRPLAKPRGELKNSLDGVVRPGGPGPKTLSMSYSIPINRPPVIMPKSHDFWKGCQVEDPDQIVECYQRLDQAELDFLTTVAEMQSSVEGIASNLLRSYTWARDMIRHARKFQFREAITSARIDGVFVGSKRSYDKILRKAERDLQNSRKKLSKVYQHSPTGVTDRLSSHWLDAQYGILPTVLTISDLIDTLNRKRFEFERRKVTVNTNLDFPTELGVYKLVQNNSTLRRTVWGKIKLDHSKNNLFNSFRQYGKFNPVLTAWELVPLSFVVDWFTGIGDKLSTLDISPLYEKFFMTSFKAEVDVSYEYETPSGTFVYRITGSGYRRKFTDTNQRFSINLKAITRFEHFVTSFSLLWHRARGNKLPKGTLNG